MHDWETRMRLKHYLELGMTKAELSKRFGVSRRTVHYWIESGQLDRGLSASGTCYSPRPPVTHKLDRSILGTAEVPFWRTGAMEFSLPRPPSVALREYVPGNLIYANGNRFVARHFHRDVDEQRIEMPVFEVSTDRQAVKETNAAADPSGLGATVLRTISVCDVDLVHQSHISDEEELRFQMGVAVYGLERGQHSGGTAWRWGEQAIHLRNGVSLRLVDVGGVDRHRALYALWLPGLHGVWSERFPIIVRQAARSLRRDSRRTLRPEDRSGGLLCRCRGGCAVVARLREPDGRVQRA